MDLPGREQAHEDRDTREGRTTRGSGTEKDKDKDNEGEESRFPNPRTLVVLVTNKAGRFDFSDLD